MYKDTDSYTIFVLILNSKRRADNIRWWCWHGHCPICTNKKFVLHISSCILANICSSRIL